MAGELIDNGVQHFKFEEDFVEDNVRCIPMIVRFKLDAVGIKLKLAEWSRLHTNERSMLAQEPCSTPVEKIMYLNNLRSLVRLRTGNEATGLAIDKEPSWANLKRIEPALQDKAKEHNWHITLEQWKSLNNLQRFALLKLFRPGHENKNFPKAMVEFGLVKAGVNGEL
ncbi:MAG: nitrate reductase associated protein [Ferruginibacter sp.]